MEKQWFVIHTLTGQEMKVRESVSRRLQLEEMEDYVDEVIIPTEEVQEVKKGVKSTMTRKFFPGYVLIQLALYDEERELIERSWRFIKETTGVIGFVGGERPVPLRPSEVDDILNQVEEKQEKVSPKVSFTIGESVKINDGPFVSHTGPIQTIDPDRGKLTVMVSVFGREVPVELEYWQVERA
jgi:transcriptional antiterminator NusG